VILAAAAGCGALAGLALRTRYPGSPDVVRAGIVCGLFVAASSTFIIVLMRVDANVKLPIPAFIGLLFALTPLLALWTAGLLPVRVSSVGLLGLGGAVLFVPLAPRFPYSTASGIDILDPTRASWLIGQAFTVLAILVSLVLLFRRGGSADGMGSAVVSAVALMALLAVHVEYDTAPWFSVLGLTVTVILWAWAMPLAKGTALSVRLAEVSPAVHRRLMSAELHRRLAAVTAHDYYRAARQRLRDGKLDLAGYGRRQRRLDDAADRDRLVHGDLTRRAWRWPPRPGSRCGATRSRPVGTRPRRQ
jgi:hypothetical protein